MIWILVVVYSFDDRLFKKACLIGIYPFTERTYIRYSMQANITFYWMAASLSNEKGSESGSNSLVIDQSMGHSE